MIVLAFDTSMARCSAALWRDGAVVAERAAEIARGHAEALMPMLQEVMAEAGVAYADLERIGVTTGPGSFTGLRIGLSAARGLALATGVSAFGISTLEAVARAAADAHPDRDIFVVLDTGRPEVFVQRFAPDLSPRTPLAATADPAASLPETPVAIAGNGAERLRSKAGNTAVFADAALPHARDVAAIAAARAPGEAGGLAPLYIHPSYAKAPG